MPPPLIAHVDAVELAVPILVLFYTYCHTLCMQAAKEPPSLHIYTGSPEPSFLDIAINASTKIKCASSFDLFFVLQVLNYLACFEIRKDRYEAFYIDDHVTVWHDQ